MARRRCHRFHWAPVREALPRYDVRNRDTGPPEARAPPPAHATLSWRITARRLPTDSLEALLLSLAALAVASILFGGFVALQGYVPLAVYQTLYLGAFGTRFSLENTLTQAAPLLLTALCTLIPARVGLLVIGGEGAVVLGGLGAVVAGLALAGVPPSLGTTLVIAAGA